MSDTLINDGHDASPKRCSSRCSANRCRRPMQYDEIPMIRLRIRRYIGHTSSFLTVFSTRDRYV